MHNFLYCTLFIGIGLTSLEGLAITPNDEWGWTYTDKKGCAPATSVKVSGEALTLEALLADRPYCKIVPTPFESQYGLLIVECKIPDTKDAAYMFYAKSLSKCRQIPTLIKKLKEASEDQADRAERKL